MVLTLWPATSQAGQSVTLTWDPSPEPDIAGYTLYYGLASSAYIDIVSPGNTNITSVAGLADATTYYFVVTTFDTSGLESLPSNEISYTTPTVVPDPWPPASSMAPRRLSMR